MQEEPPQTAMEIEVPERSQEEERKASGEVTPNFQQIPEEPQEPKPAMELEIDENPWVFII